LETDFTTIEITKFYTNVYNILVLTLVMLLH